MPGSSSSENSCVSCAMQRKELATMLAMVEGEPHYASTVKRFSKNRIEKIFTME